MFKKKPTIKNLSSLRSSDRRKIADQIIKDYNISIPSSPAETSSDQAAQTAAGTPNLSSIRNALLPENCQTARFTTTAGPDLRNVQGIIYVGAHPGEDERVLWFKVEQGPFSDKKIYPTVYTLWRNPDLIPLLHTPDMVMQKMQGGADLMTPGLANDPPFDPRAVKGSPVAVASLNSHSVPLFVGICEIDVSALQEVQGTKGHAIRGLHWQGDELWSWSPSSRPGRPAPEYLKGWDEEATEDVEEGVAQMTLDEGIDTAPNDRPDDFVEESEAAPTEPALDLKEPTTKEIDDVFVNAFIFSLYKLKQDKPWIRERGLESSITPSMLISNHITPYLPIFHPQQAQLYNIKKTSWKNIKKFIKHLDKLQLVKSKDRNGQETVILDVDLDDHRVERFTPYRLASQSAQSKARKAADPNPDDEGTNPTDDSDPTIGQDLNIKTLYRPTAKLVPIIFPALSASDPKNFFTSSEVSAHVYRYLESQDPPIISKTNARIIALNPYLAETVFTSTSGEDKATLKRGQTTRDGLVKRIQEDRKLLQPHYAILKSGQTLADVKPKAGSAPKIVMTLEKRSGNKTMTKITNLEIFGIIPGLLAEDLQKKCASSTSVSQATAAPKGVMEVLVQGNQGAAAYKALEERGVGKKFVEWVDKTKKKKT